MLTFTKLIFPKCSQYMLVFPSSACSANQISISCVQQPKYSLKRWSPLMLPYITQEMWIKSSQWAGLTRELAEVVDRDTLILNIFGMFCRAPSCVGGGAPCVRSGAPCLRSGCNTSSTQSCSTVCLSWRWIDGTCNMARTLFYLCFILSSTQQTPF